MRVIYEFYANKIILIFIIFGLVLPSFSFTPTPNLVWGFSQNQVPIKVPQTLEETKGIGKKILGALPDVLKEIWQDGLRITKEIWQKIKTIWDSYIGYRIKAFWQRILAIFGKEIKKRKEILKEEFPKEKEELKEELSKVNKSLWERFKKLIK